MHIFPFSFCPPHPFNHFKAKARFAHLYKVCKGTNLQYQALNKRILHRSLRVLIAAWCAHLQSYSPKPLRTLGLGNTVLKAPQTSLLDYTMTTCPYRAKGVVVEVQVRYRGQARRCSTRTKFRPFEPFLQATFTQSANKQSKSAYTITMLLTEPEIKSFCQLNSHRRTGQPHSNRFRKIV